MARLLRGQHTAHGTAQYRCGGRAHRLRHRHMGDRATPKESVVTVLGQVDELVRQHHVERLEIFTQRTHG